MLKTRLVKFETSDKLILPGLLYEPSHKTKRAAIYLHGMGSSIFNTVTYTETLAIEITKRNISFMPFNNRGSNLIQKFRVANKRKKESRIIGMSHEVIKDCIKDIDGAIKYLKSNGYTDIYLIGHSTGANKICVYSYYKATNIIQKYVLLGGGDDTGLAYKSLGQAKFQQLLNKAKTEIKKGNAGKIVNEPLYGQGDDDEEMFSYQAVYDILNPNGDYNTFPFLEAIEKVKLSKESLFRHFHSINKPTLVVYGSDDEYCYNNVAKCIETLQQYAPKYVEVSYNIIQKADHNFYNKEKELAKLIGNWL